jgi:hypothetical protein
MISRAALCCVAGADGWSDQLGCSTALACRGGQQGRIAHDVKAAAGKHDVLVLAISCGVVMAKEPAGTALCWLLLVNRNGFKSMFDSNMARQHGVLHCRVCQLLAYPIWFGTITCCGRAFICCASVCNSSFTGHQSAEECGAASTARRCSGLACNRTDLYGSWKCHVAAASLAGRGALSTASGGLSRAAATEQKVTATAEPCPSSCKR